MAAGAGLVRAVLGERLAQRQVAELRLVGRQLGNIRRRRAGCARRAAGARPSSRASPGWCAGRARSSSGRPPSAAVRRARTSARRRRGPIVAVRRLRHAVVLGQDRVDERVVAVEEIEHRTDPAGRRPATKRIGSSNIAWRSSFVNARESLAIDAVVFFEAAEVEPVAAELGRQAAGRGRRAASAAPARRAPRACAGRRPRHAPATRRPACSTRGSSSAGWRARSPTAAARRRRTPCHRSAGRRDSRSAATSAR